MMLMDVLAFPGKTRQILPSSASSAAQMRMQSADSREWAGESAAPAGLQTIHSPLRSMWIITIQMTSLRSIYSDRYHNVECQRLYYWQIRPVNSFSLLHVEKEL